MTYEIDVHRACRAAPETVWGLLADATGWSGWGPWSSAGLDREGDPPPGGVGAIRRFGYRRTTSIEEVTGFDPPRQLRYRLLRGLPVRDYEAEVTVAPADGAACDVRWHSRFQALPVLGWAVHRRLAPFIEDVLVRLVAEAERQQATTGPSEAG